MRAHELAKALLARRDNEVRVVVPHDDGGGTITFSMVPLGDDDNEPEAIRVPSRLVVGYQPIADVVVIRAGATYPGPRRDDAVAAWLKRHRDVYQSTVAPGASAYAAIDDLLDDYYEHADTGDLLSEDVKDPDGQPR
jgi:hypothetical protein